MSKPNSTAGYGSQSALAADVEEFQKFQIVKRDDLVSIMIIFHSKSIET